MPRILKLESFRKKRKTIKSKRLLLQSMVPNLWSIPIYCQEDTRKVCQLSNPTLDSSGMEVAPWASMTDHLEEDTWQTMQPSEEPRTFYNVGSPTTWPWSTPWLRTHPTSPTSPNPPSIESLCFSKTTKLKKSTEEWPGKITNPIRIKPMPRKRHWSRLFPSRFWTPTLI